METGDSPGVLEAHPGVVDYYSGYVEFMILEPCQINLFSHGGSS